ncbi:MAG: type II secretion system major pseudopilin GspG [Pirellulaceae bacterium]|jgi:general secretion pathway protein G|nr:type II secretion system major pseudopilin GspG [Pirellulaceae bacterium]
MFRFQRRRRRQGFTLMEVLLVLAILVILGSMVGFFIAGMQKGAYQDLARTQIGMFENQLDVYRLHIGSYPNSNQGLQSLRVPPADLQNPAKWRGPYSQKEIPTDPWGNNYQYELLGPEQYRIWSMGPDGVSGTEDDVANVQ